MSDILSTQSIEEIIKHEIHYHFSKSGGHGGQNVNKRMTKAELYFNIDNSIYLDEEQKIRLKDLGGNHVHHHSSILILTCQEERYQYANKKKVTEYFRSLLNQLNNIDKERIETKVPHREKLKIKSNKIKHSHKKQARKKISTYVD